MFSILGSKSSINCLSWSGSTVMFNIEVMLLRSKSVFKDSLKANVSSPNILKEKSSMEIATESATESVSSDTNSS